MIIVQLNRQNFEYDVHSLVKAFYPEQDVHICYAEETECIKEGTENKRKAPEEEGKPSLTLVISFVSGESEDTGETKETEGTKVTEEVKETNDTGAEVRFIVEDQTVLRDQVAFLPSADRKEKKNELKRLLYRMLSSYTGKELPWDTYRDPSYEDPYVFTGRRKERS